MPYERLTVDAVGMEWRAGSRQLTLKRPFAERDFDEHGPQAAQQAGAEEEGGDAEQEEPEPEAEEEGAIEHAESAEVPSVEEDVVGDGQPDVRTEIAPTMYLPTTHIPRRLPSRRQIF